MYFLQTIFDYGERYTKAIAFWNNWTWMAFSLVLPNPTLSPTWVVSVWAKISSTTSASVVSGHLQHMAQRPLDQGTLRIYFRTLSQMESEAYRVGIPSSLKMQSKTFPVTVKPCYFWPFLTNYTMQCLIEPHPAVAPFNDPVFYIQTNRNRIYFSYIRRWSSPHCEPCNDMPKHKKRQTSLMQLKHDRDGDNQKVEDVPGSPQVQRLDRPRDPNRDKMRNSDPKLYRLSLTPILCTRVKVDGTVTMYRFI